MDTHYDIVHLEHVTSTQEIAKSTSMLSGNATLVVADRQTEGKGRQGRRWIEPDRGMFSSFSFESNWGIDRYPLIPLCAAVAVRRAILAAGLGVSFKWPNDLMVEGGKIGGILVESSDGVVTVGCGVNLWWPSAPDFARSLFAVEPHQSAAIDLAESWVAELIVILAEGADNWPRSEYTAECITVGAAVRWQDGNGVAEAVNGNGSLRVRTDGGAVDIHSGDVHLLSSPCN